MGLPAADGLGDTEGGVTTNHEDSAGGCDDGDDGSSSSSFHWTAATVLQAIALMILAGLPKLAVAG